MSSFMTGLAAAVLLLAQFSTAIAQGRTSLLNGERADAFLKQYANSSEEVVINAVQETVGGPRLDGFALSIARGLYQIIESRPSTGSHPECNDKVREAKMQWHRDNNGSVPDEFGKIVLYKPVPGMDDTWTGEIAVCTWHMQGKVVIDEYFVHLKFVDRFSKESPNSKQLRTHTKPFGGTLDFSVITDAEVKDWMEMWNYKLHAGGDAIKVVAATRNGAQLPASERESLTNCFDIFFVKPPTTSLPEQDAYCLGRCDMRVLNTGR